MKRYYHIYKECIRISFRTAATYRVNFFLNSVIMLMGDILFPLITILMYGSGAGFKGWNVYQVLLIQSVFTMSMAVADMTFHGIMWATMQAVREGNFEMTLLLPVDTMFILMAKNFSIDAIGALLGGLTIFFVSLYHIQISSLWMWVSFTVLFLVGLMVMFGMALMMAATTFRWVGNSRIPEIFNSIRTFGKYPQTIFPKSILCMTSFLIPVAMIGFFPAAALMGKVKNYMYLAIFPCFIFMVLGIMLYRFMIRSYQGVGG